MTISKPNPEKVAAERLQKGAGEKVSPASPESPQPEERVKRKYTKRSDHWGEKKDTGPAPRTPDEIKQGAQMCAFLSATIWDILAPFMKHRPLEDAEAMKLGEALDPVLYKYLPGLSGYGLEINLLLVVGALWQTTAIAPKPPGPEKPEAELRLLEPSKTNVTSGGTAGKPKPKGESLPHQPGVN